MAYTPLTTARLANLPLILAGPILRRTEKNAVTVWVALKKDSPVRLTIQEQSDSTTMFAGDVPGLLKLGPNLFVGAITARTTDTTKQLAPGVLYQYELEFQTAEGTKGLAATNVFRTAGGSSGFAYGSMRLPTFALPPASIDQVRITHGSCRKPHGEGYDALAILDDVIAKDAGRPLVRPHVLFLTGDQIYADDVADALLKMISDASAVLIQTKEQLATPLPVYLEDQSMQAAAALGDLPPGARTIITLAAGFTSGIDKPEVAKSHLMTMGEFLCMHLFAWSDVLWATDLPSYREARGADPDPSKRGKLWETFTDEAKLLGAFRNDLPRVRRALANIPTYMAFDDHEITDDWNLHYSWCNGVLGAQVTTSMSGSGQIANHGRQIVANGMAAYAVCQAWGNAPATFASGNGVALLAACAEWTKNPTPAARDALQTFLLPPKEQPFSGREIALPSKPVAWSYGVRYDAFEVLALDCRTRRDFPRGGKDPSELLSRAALLDQVSGVSGQSDYLIIVCPAPVFGVERMEIMQEIVAAGDGYEAAIWDMEPWSAAITARERLFAQLAARAPMRGSGTTARKRQRVVLLSGDVHYAFLRRMRYWATAPYDAGASEMADLLVIQATSSSLRNQIGFTISMQGGGAGAGRVLAPRPGLALRAYGFSNFDAQQRSFGLEPVASGDTVAMMPIVASGSPVVVEVVAGSTFSIAHEWRYRLDNIADDRSETLRAPDLPAARPPAPKPMDRKLDQLDVYATRSALRTGRNLVGYNNVGEITLSPQEVVQILYWRLPRLGADQRVGLNTDPAMIATTRLPASADFDTPGW